MPNKNLSTVVLFVSVFSIGWFSYRTGLCWLLCFSLNAAGPLLTTASLDVRALSWFRLVEWEHYPFAWMRPFRSTNASVTWLWFRRILGTKIVIHRHGNVHVHVHTPTEKVPQKSWNNFPLSLEVSTYCTGSTQVWGIFAELLQWWFFFAISPMAHGSHVVKVLKMSLDENAFSQQAKLLRRSSISTRVSPSFY